MNQIGQAFCYKLIDGLLRRYASAQKFLQFDDRGIDPVLSFFGCAGAALLTKLPVIDIRVFGADGLLYLTLFFDRDGWPLDPMADVFEFKNELKLLLLINFFAYQFANETTLASSNGENLPCLA